MKNLKGKKKVHIKKKKTYHGKPGHFFNGSTESISQNIHKKNLCLAGYGM